MKILLLSLAFVSYTFTVFGQSDGVDFENKSNWEQVREKAKLENKFIFLDIFATWCQPCKAMDREVFPSKKLGDFINDKFISVQVQADTSKLDNNQIKGWYADAHRIIVQNTVNAYPTQLFFTPEGKLVSKGLGYKGIEDLIQLASDALDPDKQYYTLLQKFDAGQLDYLKMPNLVAVAKSFGDRQISQRISDKYINTYLLKLDSGDLFTEKNLKFIGQNMDGTNGSSYNFFTLHREIINSTLKSDFADYAIRAAITKEYLSELKGTILGEPYWNAIEKRLTAKFGILAQEAVYGKRLLYYENQKDWKNYGKYYVLYFKTALKRPEFNINNLSWIVFQNVNDPRVLQYAADVVMKYAMGIWYQNDLQAFDTYANLLYKLGRTKEAIRWEEKALAGSKGNSDYENVFKEILEKMRRGDSTWSIMPNKLK